jgi:hypothetical protein
MIQQWLLTKKRKGGSIEQPAGKQARTEQEVGGVSRPAGSVCRGGALKEGRRPSPDPVPVLAAKCKSA